MGAEVQPATAANAAQSSRYLVVMIFPGGVSEFDMGAGL
jgi:hypothetical protein